MEQLRRSVFGFDSQQHTVIYPPPILILTTQAREEESEPGGEGDKRRGGEKLKGISCPLPCQLLVRQQGRQQQLHLPLSSRPPWHPSPRYV